MSCDRQNLLVITIMMMIVIITMMLMTMMSIVMITMMLITMMIMTKEEKGKSRSKTTGKVTCVVQSCQKL